MVDCGHVIGCYNRTLVNPFSVVNQHGMVLQIGHGGNAVAAWMSS